MPQYFKGVVVRFIYSPWKNFHTSLEEVAAGGAAGLTQMFYQMDIASEKNRGSRRNSPAEAAL